MSVLTVQSVVTITTFQFGFETFCTCLFGTLWTSTRSTLVLHLKNPELLPLAGLNYMFITSDMLFLQEPQQAKFKLISSVRSLKKTTSCCYFVGFVFAFIKNDTENTSWVSSACVDERNWYGDIVIPQTWGKFSSTPLYHSFCLLHLVFTAGLTVMIYFILWFVEQNKMALTFIDISQLCQTAAVETTTCLILGSGQ